MEKRKRVVLPVQKDGDFCYSIVLEDSFENLAVEMEKLETAERRICIVTDSQVGPLYVDSVKEALKKICRKVTVYTIETGEEHKTLDTVKGLYEHLILEHFDRKDLLTALGGGVTGDLTGYTAATYLRGIRFVQIPTTLLSQVDSSIGGKTGVDFDSWKNMVGAFHMPSLVYMNLLVLKTLPKRQFASGMAEILKHGLIRSRTYYQWLLEHCIQIQNLEYDCLLSMIEESCRIKRAVVEADPTEQGERALLNFGHTIGHAVEKLKNFQLLHGECVAVGIVAAAWISLRRGLLSREEFEEIREGFRAFSLPVSIKGLEAGCIVEATRSDKKMEAGSIKFVLLKKIGEAFADRTVSEEELLCAASRILEEYENDETRSV